VPHSYSNLLIHTIFSTHERVRSIDQVLKPRLCPYLAGILRECECFPVEVNAVEDHLHFLAQVTPRISVADLVRVVKANSSKWVHAELTGKQHFAWQAGYAAFSVSESNREAVARYIRDQEVHHRNMFFQEEIIRHLKKYRIPYDERHLRR